MQNTNILFTTSKYDRIKNKLLLAKNKIASKHKTIKHKVKNLVHTFDNNTTSNGNLHIKMSTKKLNKLEESDLDHASESEICASVCTDLNVTVKSTTLNACTAKSVARKLVVSTSRKDEKMVEPRLKFKIPSKSCSDPTLMTKIIHVDKKNLLTDTKTSHDLLDKQDRRQLKNWNTDTTNVSVEVLQQSLRNDFNTHYANKHGKFPSRVQLASRGFGRPSKKHCFTSDVTFDHVLVVIYKSNYLSESDVVNLNMTHLLYKHLYSTLNRVKNTDFRDINIPDPNYMDQAEITQEKKFKFLAAALYYDFHLGSVMRYAGENYTGEFRNIEYIMSQIRGIAPDEICDNVEKLLKVGAPHEMYGHSTYENFKTYKDYGNHKSILLKPEKIKKVMNKENKYCYAMAFPAWIARFVPNMHLTPQGLVVKPGKNDRLIFDASIKIKWDSYNINMATDNSTAPKIYYGEKFAMHLKRIWNLRISFPLLPIFLWDDDVAGAFRQGKYNPEVASAFCFIIFGVLWLPCGQTFGGNTSPHCYEPLANAREYLAKHLSHPRYKVLIEKHWDLIKNVEFEPDDARDGNPVQARKCSKNKGVINVITCEQDNTEHNTFVDDNHIADLRVRMYQAMAASIESLYRVFGFPEEEIRRISLSMDKYFQAKCSTRKLQLGLVVDTHLMTVELPEEKRAKIVEQLDHWHEKRKSFTVLQAAQLLGIIEHTAMVTPWIRYMLNSLRHSLLRALRENRTIVHEDKTMKEFLENSTYKGNEYRGLLRKKFADSKIAQKIWHLKTKFYINTSMRAELTLLRNIFKNNEKYKLYTPISYLVDRDPDFLARGDACLDGAGGYCVKLNFFWFVEWPDEIKIKTLRHFKIRLMIDEEKKKFISINLLEYATIIITFAGCIQAIRNNKMDLQYPLLSVDSDNTSAVSWTKKAVHSNKKGKALARIFCKLLMTNELGIRSQHIAGDKNVQADKISRIKSENFLTSFRKIQQEHPELRHCRQFQPHPSLLSCLMHALLHGTEQSKELPEILGQFSRE